ESSLRSPTGNLVNANRIEAGRPIAVPSPGNPYEGFEFEVDGPPGEGRLVGILSKQPMKWLKIPGSPRTFSERADALGYIAGLNRLLERGLEVEAKQPDSGISVVIKSYKVVR